MAADLSPTIRQQMVEFVQRELLTEKWMRTQSMLDVAAAHSDRPDHGPMGAYDAWPAVTVDALCTLGSWENAISFLRSTRVAVYEGVYAQAREFTGQGGVSMMPRSGSHSAEAACENAREAGPLLRPSSIHCSDIYPGWDNH